MMTIIKGISCCGCAEAAAKPQCCITGGICSMVTPRGYLSGCCGIGLEVLALQLLCAWAAFTPVPPVPTVSSVCACSTYMRRRRTLGHVPGSLLTQYCGHHRCTLIIII